MHGLWAHVVHLIGDRFDPILGGLDARNHSSQLGPDDGLGMQRFSERNTLI